MSIAFIFAGQGSQTVGMGKDFYESYDIVKEIYDRFPEIKKLCFEGPKEELDQTEYCQKAMLLTGYAIANVLKENGITPEYTCGLSLGEYTALAFGNAWKLEDAIKIITARGEIMQNALPCGTSTMAAVLGLERQVILDVISDIDGVVEIANYNCPGQIVITGEKDAVSTAMEKLTIAGARRVLPLNVSGAFHSSLLKNASKELRDVLDKYENKESNYKNVYNLTGKESNDPLYDLLEKQICNSVYFEDSIRYMISKGVDTFVEIGPGRALTGFVKKIDADVKVYNVSNLAGLEETIGGLK